MYGNILEEELKNKVAADWFAAYDTTQIIGRVDFCVSVPGDDLGLCETESLLWAEAKRGTSHDIYASFVQLILTIGRERTFDRHLPPMFLGAFDAEKIAFLPYNAVLDTFYQNDFNWNVAPSDHDSREFRQLYGAVREAIERDLLLFRFREDADELHRFIRRNFTAGRQGVSRVRINKNNFTHIYQRWLAAVKPTIAGVDWEKAKRKGIIDADFYLADILSEHNLTLKEKLYVLLRGDHYELDRHIDDDGFFSKREAQFADNQVAHTQFWNHYSRPPRREYWDYIARRRDLLVPQDFRERKGSFFTPRRWVEFSQQYLAAELGEDWQESYDIWDCCAGTGNLLNGLTNKYRVWASTVDEADVQVMHDSIQSGTANLLESHVFQFDFLNDPFTRLPQGLQDIIADPDRRRHLIIYINPPYAEASSGQGRGYKKGVASDTYVYKTYAKELGPARKELFAQFFMRIYKEIPSCRLAEFSKLKILQASNFRVFRESYRAKLGRNFVVPADTFDNVKGDFPIGFMIWDLGIDCCFWKAEFDVYGRDKELIGKKAYYNIDNVERINAVLPLYQESKPKIGVLMADAPDYQNCKYVSILNERTGRHGIFVNLTEKNVIVAAIYLAVRWSYPAYWLNDRDQFLYPSDGWQKDYEFQADCLVFTLLHGQNRISIASPTGEKREGATNHWLPFTEEEVGAKDNFRSHFITDLLNAPARPVCCCTTATPTAPNLFAPASGTASPPIGGDIGGLPLRSHMSSAARAAMQAGRELWRYYHAQPGTLPDASFYDIRLHFQGTKVSKSGKVQMNPDSTDAEYTRLIKQLRAALRDLAAAIAPKVYLYGFLKR